MADEATLRQNIFTYCELMLGGQMVDVELDVDHYNSALNTLPSSKATSFLNHCQT